MPTSEPPSRPGDEVLDEHVVLQHADLDPAAALAHHHRALDRLAPGQELGLGEDRLDGGGPRRGRRGGAGAWPPGGWSRGRSARRRQSPLSPSSLRGSRGARMRVTVPGGSSSVESAASSPDRRRRRRRRRRRLPSVASASVSSDVLGVVCPTRRRCRTRCRCRSRRSRRRPGPDRGPGGPDGDGGGRCHRCRPPVVEVVGGVRVGGVLGGDVGGDLGGGVRRLRRAPRPSAATAPPRRRGLARCLLDGGLGPRRAPGTSGVGGAKTGASAPIGSGARPASAAAPESAAPESAAGSAARSAAPDRVARPLPLERRPEAGDSATAEASPESAATAGTAAPD